jgi:dTDP-4-amino-4,6-dideoxygalactose transaminase
MRDSAHREIGSELDLELASAFSRRLQPLARMFPGASSQPLLTESGRAALRAALWAWINRNGNGGRFLIPAYLCVAVLQPFRELGIEVDFYRIGRRLEIDWDEIARKLDTGKYSGFLLIRYFGSSIQNAPPKGFLERWPEVTAIEDAAQAFLTPGVGGAGAYTVYSLRKWIGMPDGGAVIGRTPGGLSLLPGGSRFAYERLAAFELRQAYRAGNLRSKQPYLDRFHEAESILDGDAGGVAAMSGLSERILRTSDLRAIAAARRENFRFLMTRFPKFKNVAPLGMAWGERDVPLGFPIVCRGRDRIRLGLKQKRIYCPIHWKMPPMLEGLPEAREALALSRSILTLPCDQRYTTVDMEYMLSCLRDVARGLRN